MGTINNQFDFVIGHYAEEAKEMLVNRGIIGDIQILNENSAVTMEYRINRIRLWVDNFNIVTGVTKG